MKQGLGQLRMVQVRRHLVEQCSMLVLLLRVIMNPAMIMAWIAGLIMIGLGAFDWGAVWSWVKLISVILMTAAHGWMSARRK